MPPPNAFLGRTAAPSDADLATALGPAITLWRRLLDALQAAHPKLTAEWYSYSPKKAGWSLRCKLAKRTLLYLIPSEGSCRVAFIFGDKALRAIAVEGFPSSVLDAIAAATRYSEGTGITADLQAPEDIPTICRLTDVKIRH
jgi:hypothetical protein